jgi:zinc transport system substrate-binding protein
VRRLPAAFLVLAVGCSPASEPTDPVADATDTGKLVVYVTSEPLRAMAERIGGDTVEVHFPAPADVDPADWSPSADVVARYQAADLVLRNGAGYDAWIDRATLRDRALVDTSAEYADRLIRIEMPTHQHGPQGEHSHGTTASTTWLDPDLARHQARAVATAFSAARPDASEEFGLRAAALEAELQALDLRLAAVAERLAGEPIFYSHPVYDYLDRRYALDGRSLHWEPGAVPLESEWRALRILLRDHPARLILWEADPLPETAARLADLGVESVVFAPCGNRCADDWLAAMQANAARLAAFERD